MSRRIWFVLLIVVAVLAIAPHLPQWWPLAVTAVREFDYAALGHNLAAGAEQVLELAMAHPQVVGGVAGGFLLVTFGVMLVRAWRASRARRAEAAALVEEIEAEERAASAAKLVPVAAAAPVALAVPVAAAQPRPTPAPARRLASRGPAVRRLSLAGHSTAEIARATRVGQDAVRLVLHRQGTP